MADVEATKVILLDLTKNISQLTQEAMDNHPVISTIPKPELLNILNLLLANGKLDLFQSDTQTYYKLKKAPITMAGMAAATASTTEEKLLLQIIGEVGSKGICKKEIKDKSGLNQTLMTKVMKMLEQKQLIKSITPVQAGKKIFMLFGVTPASSLTGGPWWSNGQYNYQFVELLQKICTQFLEMRLESAKRLQGGPVMVKNGSFLSSAEILQMVAKLKISKVRLSVADIECILNTIVYDGKAEMSIDGSDVGGQQSKRYRMIEPLIPSAGFTHIPCGICPVINRCSTTGPITAKTCEYFDSW